MKQITISFIASPWKGLSFRNRISVFERKAAEKVTLEGRSGEAVQRTTNVFS